MRYDNVEYRKVETDTRHAQSLADIAHMRLDGWSAEKVDGKIPVDFCEICDRPIFEDDDYQCDREGVYWHTECPEDQPLPKLLPCPFCGGCAAIGRCTSSANAVHSTEFYGHCISCRASHHSITFGGYPDELTAVEKWNQRTQKNGDNPDDD